MTPAEQLASFKLYLSGISYDESSGWIEDGIKSGRVTFDPVSHILTSSDGTRRRVTKDFKFYKPKDHFAS